MDLIDQQNASARAAVSRNDRSRGIPGDRTGGARGFSTRKLAAEFGCEAMSIYHHFPSMAHLFEALVDRVVGALEIPPAICPGGKDAHRNGRIFAAGARALPPSRLSLSPTA